MSDAAYETPLVPPLGEAPVTDWIRHHMARTCADYPEPTRADLAEVNLAARSKMLCAFKHARAGLATYIGGLTLDEHVRMRDFYNLRLARLRMGHLRYGVCGINRYDAIGSCSKRLEEYAAGGNLEHLVDIANLCEIEYWWPQREGTRWIHGCMGYHNIVGPISIYAGCGCLTCLAHAVNLAESEYIRPTHPEAHWEAQDCGGHWSLRNNTP